MTERKNVSWIYSKKHEMGKRNDSLLDDALDWSVELKPGDLLRTTHVKSFETYPGSPVWSIEPMSLLLVLQGKPEENKFRPHVLWDGKVGYVTRNWIKLA